MYVVEANVWQYSQKNTTMVESHRSYVIIFKHTFTEYLAQFFATALPQFP